MTEPIQLQVAEDPGQDLGDVPERNTSSQTQPSDKRERRRYDDQHKNRPSIGHKVAALERRINQYDAEVGRLRRRMDRVEHDARIFEILAKMNENLENVLESKPPASGTSRVGSGILRDVALVFVTGVLVLAAAT